MPAFEQLTRFLLVVAIVLGVCHLAGALCVRLRQPPVVGELAGALLLGPSLLGALAPGAQHALFTPALLTTIDLAGQLGLVVFMLLLGSELRTDLLDGDRRTVGLVVAGTITVPFAAGFGFAASVGEWFAPRGVPFAAYLVFFGLAISITAMPVLARILTDHRVEGSPTGTLALAVASIGDGLAWAILAVVLAAKGAGDPGTVVVRGLIAVVLLIVSFALVRPALAAVLRRAGRRGTGERAIAAFLVTGAVAFAAATDAIGLHPVIGAFLFGVLLPRGQDVVTRAGSKLNDFAVVVLLPLFFASVGQKANFAAFGGREGWLLLGAGLAVAMFSKFAGTAGAATLAGKGRRQSLRLGALMNCRGITELVIANVGLQHGLITPLGYTVIVLIAVVTTAITGPLARLRAADEDLLPGVPLPVSSTRNAARAVPSRRT
ncbi:hypothetical protein SD37_34305 [Amycolatopsis orientalis]|uniref:Cation/H+ exchanger transmembrane domain-containing protein n=1 Tax=Amycolatopsis orientalis TaxID=31958 RepID=A0A193C766_AMYOR|nr:cation:proton antiporter [Amycolatopsis orientalis]ANN20170.1 hypothetical protein SD37_34305 [Amycolatopsis orientalis]